MTLTLTPTLTLTLALTLAIKAYYNLNRDIALDILKNACPEIFNMFMQKYNNNANAFISGMRDGIVDLQQSEGE